MTVRVGRMMVDAPERYRGEIEEAMRMAEARGFDAEVGDGVRDGDVRLTVSGVEDPDEYLFFAVEMHVPVFSLDVGVLPPADALRDTVELDRAFDEAGLYAEFSRTD